MNTKLSIAQFTSRANIFITTNRPCGLIRVGDEIRSKPVIADGKKSIMTYVFDSESGLWLYGERIVPFTQDEQLDEFFATGNFLPGVGRNTMIDRLLEAGFIAKEKSKFILTSAGTRCHIENVEAAKAKAQKETAAAFVNVPVEIQLVVIVQD